jgi:hypothetical protein
MMLPSKLSLTKWLFRNIVTMDPYPIYPHFKGFATDLFAVLLQDTYPLQKIAAKGMGVCTSVYPREAVSAQETPPMGIYSCIQPRIDH